METPHRSAPTRAPVRSFWRRHAEQFIALLFVAPAIAYVGYFAFYPVVDTVVLSFQTPIHPFTTFNYEYIVDQGLYTWIGNTLWLTAGALALQFALALGIASIISREFRGKALFSTIMILPIGIATVVGGFVFNQILPGTGAGYGNSILASFGLGPYYWLNSTSGALTSVVIADSWKNTALVVIILVAGYASIPRSLYQAAAIDGAGALRRFRYVTLPGLRSFIVIALLIRGAQEVNIFQIAYIMIGSSTQLLTVQIYALYLTSGGIYLASASSTILIGIVCVFIVVILIIGGRK